MVRRCLLNWGMTDDDAVVPLVEPTKRLRAKMESNNNLF